MSIPLPIPIYTPEPTTPLPLVARVRQHLDTTSIQDIPGAVAAGFAAHAPAVIQPGMRVAITAGSRGIANIVPIIAAVVTAVRRGGGEPYLVAAMGSHGGATEDGQRAVLAGYGITPEQVSCPISTTMETVCLGHTADGLPVYTDRFAYQADAIILLNRVKPHSILTGKQGSGLMKMAAIGLGKAIGANTLHTAGLEQHLLPVARMVLAHAPVKLGIAIVENALDQTWKIACVPAAAIEATDQRLLVEARALLPTIPFDPLDILVVDTVGKNFSGTGMDPNVIGMHRRIGGPAQRHIRSIVALDLSDESHGNAHGIGMADIITQTLVARVDWKATYTNAVTAGFFGGARLPITCPTARAAIALAMTGYDANQVRLVRVPNTAHLEEMWVSAALLDEVQQRPDLAQVSDLEALTFP